MAFRIEWEAEATEPIIHVYLKFNVVFWQISSCHGCYNGVSCLVCQPNVTDAWVSENDRR